MASSLRKKVILVTGASRGLGKAVALRCAKDGATLLLCARSKKKPFTTSVEGTLQSVAEQVRVLGGTPFMYQTDISDLGSVQKMVTSVKKTHTHIDAVVNNASSLYIGGDVKIQNTILDVNLKGTLNVIESTKGLLAAGNLKHILTVSPPIATFSPQWAVPHPPYTLSKYGMSLLTLGYSKDFNANTLWPHKLYKTAAVQRLERQSRKGLYSTALDPSVFAAAVHKILCTNDLTGISFLDSDLVDLPPGGTEDVFV